MRFLHPVLFVLVLAACSLTPEEISESIVDCQYYGLEPVAIVRRDAVQKVNCLPPEGVLIIERELELIKLPELPDLPGRD